MISLMKLTIVLAFLQRHVFSFLFLVTDVLNGSLRMVMFIKQNLGIYNSRSVFTSSTTSLHLHSVHNMLLEPDIYVGVGQFYDSSTPTSNFWLQFWLFIVIDGALVEEFGIQENYETRWSNYMMRSRREDQVHKLKKNLLKSIFWYNIFGIKI